MSRWIFGKAFGKERKKMAHTRTIQKNSSSLMILLFLIKTEELEANIIVLMIEISIAQKHMI